MSHCGVGNVSQGGFSRGERIQGVIALWKARIRFFERPPTFTRNDINDIEVTCQ